MYGVFFCFKGKAP